LSLGFVPNQKRGQMNKHLNQPNSHFNTPKWQTVKKLNFERYMEQEKQLQQFMEQFT
jgi:hypothetical protein